VLSGAYALKLAVTGEGYGPKGNGRSRDLVVGAIATLYGLWLVYAAGLSYLLMCAILFAPGILIHMKASSERGEKSFTGPEWLIAAGILALAVLAGWLLWTGAISPL
jgi:arginine:ornithine antiporter/lysine permease